MIEAIFFSFFIYLAYFNLHYLILDTLFGCTAITLFLSQKKEVNFWAGFFTGIFWFYWIALSFRYYDLGYLIPIIVVIIAIVYAIFFLLLSLPKEPFLRASLLLVASYIHPFKFSWFKPELLFVDSYLGVSKIDFAIIVYTISLSLFLYKKDKKIISIASLTLLILAFNQTTQIKGKIPDISLYDQKLPQDKKWLPRYQNIIVQKDFNAIKAAISEHKKMIILNESAFPLCLNKHRELLKKLKNLSQKIVIVTGALRCTQDGYFNSTYYFINGDIKTADKVVLVPFGEEIPLPKFLADFINKIFFDGAEDFKTAKSPTKIKIGGRYYTNAICYEATEDIIYKNHPKYIIAISNNAWFTPSIEPTLQHLLLKYYSKIYGTTILHAANMGISGAIRGQELKIY